MSLYPWRAEHGISKWRSRVCSHWPWFWKQSCQRQCKKTEFMGRTKRGAVSNLFVSNTIKYENKWSISESSYLYLRLRLRLRPRPRSCPFPYPYPYPYAYPYPTMPVGPYHMHVNALFKRYNIWSKSICCYKRAQQSVTTFHETATKYFHLDIQILNYLCHFQCSTMIKNMVEYKTSAEESRAIIIAQVNTSTQGWGGVETPLRVKHQPQSIKFIRTSGDLPKRRCVI